MCGAGGLPLGEKDEHPDRMEELVGAVEIVGCDRLVKMVVGPKIDDRRKWRINRLLLVLDALVETNATRVEIDIADDPQGFMEMIKEVRDMVQEINDFLSSIAFCRALEAQTQGHRSNNAARWP